MLCRRMARRQRHTSGRRNIRWRAHRQPHTGLRQIDRHDADQQRQRRHHLEVHQRLHADASHLPQTSMPGNARHQRAQDQRRHDHADQPQEDVAEHLALYRNPWRIDAQLHSGQHRDKDPRRQRAPRPHRQQHHAAHPQRRGAAHAIHAQHCAQHIHPAADHTRRVHHSRTLRHRTHIPSRHNVGASS